MKLLCRAWRAALFFRWYLRISKGDLRAKRRLGGEATKVDVVEEDTEVASDLADDEGVSVSLSVTTCGPFVSEVLESTVGRKGFLSMEIYCIYN